MEFCFSRPGTKQSWFRLYVKNPVAY